MNLIAIINDGKIRRLPISQDVQNELISHYNRVKENFISNKTRVNFEGIYKCEDNEIYELNEFDWKEKIKNCNLTNEGFENLITLNQIDNNDIENIKILIIKDDHYLIFQSMDNRKFIKPKSFLFYSNNTFSYEDKKGIKIDDNIDCIIELNSNSLLFTSFHNASKIFDLTDNYREATEEEIDRFSNYGIFTGELNREYLTSTMRKKIFLIGRNNILQKVQQNFQRVKEYAEQLGIDCFRDNLIEFPQDKEKMKLLINFLNEDLYKSPISNEIYESNSKRRYNKVR